MQKTASKPPGAPSPVTSPPTAPPVPGYGGPPPGGPPPAPPVPSGAPSVAPPVPGYGDPSGDSAGPLQLGGGALQLGGGDVATSPGPGGERGALLASIQMGKALKKVDKPVEKSVLIMSDICVTFLSSEQINCLCISKYRTAYS